jgi:RHS repeat-associated protein
VAITATAVSGNVTRIGPTRYSYDFFGRLGSFSSDLTRAGSGYVYDRFGNRLATTFGYCSTNPDGTVRCGGTTSPAEPILGTTNHYQNVSYDAAGNVTADRGGARTFAYDSLGMMTRAQTAGRDFHFLYTADDERVAVVERVGSANRTTWSIRNFGNELLTVWTDDATSGTRSIPWKEDEIRRGSLLLANVVPITGTKHYTLDHLGSPRLVNDSTGAHTQDFDPFGNGGLLGSGALQFTGHERDRANVGNGTADLPDYLHARSYEPTLGRFLSVDPALDVKVASASPQAWNRYSYVRNNPVGNTDPDGKICIPCAAVGALIAVSYESYRQVKSGEPVNNGRLLAAVGIGAVGGATLGAAVEAAPIAYNAVLANPAAVATGAAIVGRALGVETPTIGGFPAARSAVGKAEETAAKFGMTGEELVKTTVAGGGKFVDQLHGTINAFMARPDGKSGFVRVTMDAGKKIISVGLVSAGNVRNGIMQGRFLPYNY